MPQQPTGQKRIYQLDGSIKDEFGNTVEPAKSTPSMGLTPPPGSNAPGNATDSNWTPRDVLSTGLRGAATAASFIPGAGQLGMALRVALPALLSGGAAAVEGNDPVDEAAVQGALGGAGELAGAVPKMFNRAAFASAGLFKGKGNLAKKATNALTDLNETRPAWAPVLAGQVKKVEALKKAAGTGVEVAERATPGAVSLRELHGASKGLADDAANTARPISLRQLIAGDNKDFIYQQAMERNQISPTVWATLKPRQKMQLINDTMIDARELGELERGMGKGTNSISKARRDGVFVPEGEAQKAQLDANKIKRANDLKMKLADDAGDPGKLRAANKRFGDTATLDEAHNRMRFTGSLADMSVIGARMGIGGLIGNATGIGMVPGGIAGLALLNPPALSATGHVAGYGLKALPAATRAAQTVDTFDEEERKKRHARLRNPGE